MLSGDDSMWGVRPHVTKSCKKRYYYVKLNALTVCPLGTSKQNGHPKGPGYVLVNQRHCKIPLMRKKAHLSFHGPQPTISPPLPHQYMCQTHLCLHASWCRHVLLPAEPIWSHHGAYQQPSCKRAFPLSGPMPQCHWKPQYVGAWHHLAQGTLAHSEFYPWDA